MKVVTIGVLITIFAAVPGCSESKESKISRLKLEAIKIQEQTSRTILEYDMKFMRDFDEEEKIYAELKKEMERCKDIVVELKQISPDIDLSKLEKDSGIILAAIYDRQQRTKRDREVDLNDLEPVSGTENIIASLENTLEVYKEAGLDTKEIEQLIDQIRQQQHGDSKTKP